MSVKSYRDLQAWQVAMDLVELIYKLAKRFPAQERFGLTSQIQRAAISIPGNIAEGHGRIHRGDYLHHLSIARGSLAELETLLTLAVRLDLIKKQEAIEAWNQAQQTGKLINGLINALRRKP